MTQTSLKPFLKWAGSKQQLLPLLRTLRPASIGTYHEPFLGSGALLFDWQPQRFIVGDANAELINLYHVVRKQPKALLRAASRLPNNVVAYQYIRGLDRDAERFAATDDVTRAARMLYLNRAGFRGLYRVNRKGYCNTPYGHNKGAFTPPAERVQAASRFLKAGGGDVRCADFEDLLGSVQSGAFVYLDPPYVPLSASASFTAYTASGFGLADQQRLKRVCDALHQRGARLLISHAATPFIQSLYRDYRQEIVTVHRRIKAASSNEASAQELVIRNFP